MGLPTLIKILIPGIQVKLILQWEHFLNATFDQPLNLWNTKALYIITSILEGAWTLIKIFHHGKFVMYISWIQCLRMCPHLIKIYHPGHPNIGSLPTDFMTGAGFDGLTAKYPQWGAPCAYFNAYTNLLIHPTFIFQPLILIFQYFVDNGFPPDLTGIIFTLSDPNYTL